MRRPNWDEYFLGIAEAVSRRGDCIRRQVGAVIIDENNRLAGAGYNGTYPNGPSCLRGMCPRAKSDVPPGSSYDTGPGECIASHAEINALMDVSDRSRLNRAVMYVSTEPCKGCMKIISNSTKIIRVVWPGGDVRITR